MTRPVPLRRGRRPRLAALVASSSLLAACSQAPVADDTWPGFDPAAQPPVFLEQSALWLHVLSDRRDEPLAMRIEFAGGGEFERDLGPRTAVDDQIFVGHLDPGVLTVELSDDRRSERRTFRLEANRHHGVAFDLRTERPQPATLDLTLLAAGDGDGAPRATLYALDDVLPRRRASGTDPAGLELALQPAGDRWRAAVGDLASGEYAVRVEPGGLERLVRLAPGANAVTLDLPAPTVRVELELVNEATGAPLGDAVVRWVSAADADSPALLMDPRDAVVVDGRASLVTTPGTTHLLVNAPGLGTQLKRIQFDDVARGTEPLEVRLPIGRPVLRAPELD